MTLTQCIIIINNNITIVTIIYSLKEK